MDQTPCCLIVKGSCIGSFWSAEWGCFVLTSGQKDQFAAGMFTAWLSHFCLCTEVSKKRQYWQHGCATGRDIDFELHTRREAERTPRSGLSPPCDHVVPNLPVKWWWNFRAKWSKSYAQSLRCSLKCVVAEWRVVSCLPEGSSTWEPNLSFSWGTIRKNKQPLILPSFSQNSKFPVFDFDKSFIGVKAHLTLNLPPAQCDNGLN